MREDQKFTAPIFDTEKQAYSPVECSFTARPIDLPNHRWKWSATLLVHASEDQLPSIQLQRVGKERDILEPRIRQNSLGIPAYTWSLNEGDKIIIHGDPSSHDERNYATIWKFTGNGKVAFVEMTSLQKAKDLLVQAMKQIQSGYPIGDQGIIEFPSELGDTQYSLIQAVDKLEELCQE
jgi:hypothetical protein